MVADPSSICGWNPDMYGVRNTEAGQSYYDSLIEMYASRGVDFIKCDDFWDNWELLKNMFWRCELWQDHVKEGCFPDCDMLPLGKVGKGFETGERLSVYQGRAEDHDDTMVHVPFSADDWCRAYQNG